MTRIARCCCGDASIEVEGDPVLNAICHCSSCKRRTGTAFGWSAYFPDAAVTAKHGTAQIYAREGEAGYQRFFCARCGTTLYWKSVSFMPDFTGVAGGCFTETPLPEPQFSVQDSTRCAWISLPDHWGKTG